MGFHHVAIATRDLEATHTFYSEAMGFELVKVEVAQAGKRGFAKHLFYDTGDGRLMAIWDLHDPELSDDWSPSIATGLGLPVWTNHIAFDATDASDMDTRRQRWLDHGVDVMEIDHGWCHSIYAEDPNGILVEFCRTTRELTAEDRAEALALLKDPQPEVARAPTPKMYRAGRV